MNLHTRYLGLDLEHPVVASASPMTERLEGFQRLEDGGVSAIVMHSLFEEQIEHESQVIDHYGHYGRDSYAEALSYFPEPQAYRLAPDRYLNLLSRAKQAVKIPIIASLNGTSPGGWTRYAALMQQAGADALELNLYYIPTHPDQNALEVETLYAQTVQQVKQSVSIPVAVKVGHFFTAFAHTARRLHKAGADTLVLFNRFYQPDLDLDRLEVTPHLSLSRSSELLLRLHWVGLLYGRLGCDLAITGGVHIAKDALKGIAAGAQIVHMTSALLQNGPQHATKVVQGMAEWLQEKEYDSLDDLRGSLSQLQTADPEAFERANYLKVLGSYRVHW